MQIFDELKKRGVLLLTELAAMIAGEPIRGSWWAHPRSHEIFRTSCQLEDHNDVLVVKLIDGKVTFVHRKLWPALLAVATAREPWQMKGLSHESRKLLQELERCGTIKGKTNRELEQRLLIYATEIHTETGAHAKILESWSHWRGRVGFNERLPAVSEAKRALEAAGNGRVPWAARAE